jgi:zinc protease
MKRFALLSPARAPRLQTLALTLAGGMLLPHCSHAQATQAAVAALGPTAASALPDADAWRKTRPPTGPLPTLQAPLGHKSQLENGLTIVTVPKQALPLVHVSVVIKSGSAQDPATLPGLASFMADMLKMGTRSQSAQAIAEAVETQGASLELSADEDNIMLSATVLKDNVGAVLDVIADVLRHPDFAKDEMERARKLRLSTLSQLDSEPVHLSRRVFREVVFGQHPYGHVPFGTAPGLHKIKRQDLRAFYKTHVRPANVAVMVVGDLSVAEAQSHIEKRLGGWNGAPQTQTPPTAPTESAPQVALVPRPGAPQSQVVVGNLGVARGTPDYYPLVMCNAILGGLFNSRINMNLREDKGWTYGARSTFDFKRERGPFFVAAGIRTDVTGEAIREILGEIAKMRDSDVSEEELGNAKNRYSLSLPGYFQTVEGVSSMLASLYLFNLPDDYYQKLPEHLAAVTVADVRRVATTYLHPDKLSVVVVGDPAHVEPALRDLGRGPVHLLDAQGQLPAPQAAQAKPKAAAAEH